MALTNEQMVRLGELLDQSLPLSRAERRAWLDALHGEDLMLMRVLRDALLAEDPATAAGDALDRLPRIEPAGAADIAGSDHHAGARLGPYELLHQLGAGGMAEVWLARRADGAFERQVALKIPRLHGMPPAMAERFARECCILATLEYPGIARLYDAGVDVSGVPYIAMEYVRGEPLVAWCEARALDVPGRIRIFLEVLDAVGHAHERQVLHRDLKPSNILVTRQGEARLLDFGVARLLDPETDAALLTRDHGQALTPAYASPELLRGEPADLRSDIFSLGVVLHELLLGTRPAPQISVRASTVQARALPAALRQVLGSALAPAPADRYQDAASFAQALQPFATARGLASRVAGLTAAAGLAALTIGAAAALYGTRVAPLSRAEQVSGIATGPLPVQVPVIPETPREGDISGIAEPVPVKVRKTPAAAPPDGRVPSIAVLPARNLTGEAELDYFAAGLTEEMMDRFYAIKGLLTIGPFSSYLLENTRDDYMTIARKLRVDNLLVTSLRGDATKLRISARLIDGRTGEQRWSDVYNGNPAEGFALQEKITRGVAQTLALAADIGPLARSTGAATDFNALGRYLRWRLLVLGEWGGPEVAQQKVDMMREAVDMDPGFALGWYALSDSLGELAFFASGARAEQLHAERMQAWYRMKELSPDSANVLAYHSERLLREEKWAESEELARKILGSGPLNFGRAQPMINLLFAMGRIRETIDLQRRVMEQEPLAMFVSRDQQYNLYAAGRFEEAEKEFQRSETLDGNHAGPRELAFMRTLARTDADPGIIRERYASFEGNPPKWARDVMAVLGDRDEMRAVLRKSFDDGVGGLHVPLDILGEPDLAMEALLRIMPHGRHQSRGFYWQFWLMPNSGVRGHPKFKEMMREMGLADYWRQSGNWPDFCHSVGDEDFECR